jgi:hypothetical protein
MTVIGQGTPCLSEKPLISARAAGSRFAISFTRRSESGSKPTKLVSNGESVRRFGSAKITFSFALSARGWFCSKDLAPDWLWFFEFTWFIYPLLKELAIPVLVILACKTKADLPCSRLARSLSSPGANVRDIPRTPARLGQFLSVVAS